MIIRCPHCQARLDLPDYAEGSQVRCSICRRLFQPDQKSLTESFRAGSPESTSVTSKPRNQEERPGSMAKQGIGTTSSTWREYRLWSMLMWALFLLGFPIFFFAYVGVASLLGSDSPPLFWGSVILLGAIVLYSRMRMTNFRCPRCGDLFFCGVWRGMPYNFWPTRRCVHCGLPKWADPG